MKKTYAYDKLMICISKMEPIYLTSQYRKLPKILFLDYQLKLDQHKKPKMINSCTK